MRSSVGYESVHLFDQHGFIIELSKVLKNIIFPNIVSFPNSINDQWQSCQKREPKAISFQRKEMELTKVQITLIPWDPESSEHVE